MIIVEGVDNSGKTTLLNRLAEDLRLFAIKNYKRPTGTPDIYRFTEELIRIEKKWSVIVDRIPSISEPVYGPICRNTHWPEELHQERLHEMLRSTNPLVIYCRPKDSTILKFGERAQMEGVVDNAKELIQAYDRKIKFVNRYFQVMTYDFELHDYSLTLEAVKSHLEGARH